MKKVRSFFEVIHNCTVNDIFFVTFIENASRVNTVYRFFELYVIDKFAIIPENL